MDIVVARRHRGPLWLLETVPPNTALQRTSPALPVPPLSFQAFGVRDDRGMLRPAELGDGVIVLTLFVAEDAAAMCDGDHDSELRLRFGFPEDCVPSTEHSLDVVSRWDSERRAGSRFAFAVRDVETGTLLGGCELRPRVSGIANLSYWTYAAHRNRGMASRAVAIAIRLAVADLGFARLEILVDPDNVYSRKVAHRNGFDEIGTRDAQVLYALDSPVSPKHA